MGTVPTQEVLGDSIPEQNPETEVNEVLDVVSADLTHLAEEMSPPDKTPLDVLPTQVVEATENLDERGKVTQRIPYADLGMAA